MPGRPAIVRTVRRRPSGAPQGIGPVPRPRRAWPGGPGGPGGPADASSSAARRSASSAPRRSTAIHYRDVRLLQQFVAERGKIVPRRLTGVCTTHQRRLTRAIKQARNIALLPFAARF